MEQCQSRYHSPVAEDRDRATIFVPFSAVQSLVPPDDRHPDRRRQATKGYTHSPAGNVISDKYCRPIFAFRRVALMNASVIGGARLVNWAKWYQSKCLVTTAFQFFIFCFTTTGQMERITSG